MTHAIKTEHFDYREEQGVAILTLNRPERINALTFESYAELRDTFEKINTRSEVRAAVIQGEGARGFCSGGDVDDIIAELFSRDMQGLLEFTRLTGALVAAIHTCRVPVVAALHGVVCGAGAVIATACDLRVAAQRTKIAFLFPQVGLCGADMGSAYLLPRIVGLGRASELLFTGDFVRAPEAERMGLFNRVVPNGEHQQAAFELATRLAAGPAFAHSMTKRMLESEAHMDFRSAIEAEAQAQAICMQHPDFREAHEAFKNKREPKFKR